MSIIVKLQTELDRIPLDTNEQIYIEFGTCNNPAIVRNKYRNAVIVRGNSAVKVWDNSSVEAYGNVQVVDKQFFEGSIQILGNARKVSLYA